MPLEHHFHSQVGNPFIEEIGSDFPTSDDLRDGETKENNKNDVSLATAASSVSINNGLQQKEINSLVDRLLHFSTNYFKYILSVDF